MKLKETGILVTFRDGRGNRGKVTVFWHQKKIGTIKPGGEFTRRLPGAMALYGVTVKGDHPGDAVQITHIQEVKP